MRCHGVHSPPHSPRWHLYTAVLYVLNGKQTSSSFNDHAEALRFQELANRTSPAKALEVWATQAPGLDGFTAASWCTHHVDHLTGVKTYESLARKGETMTTAAMATYAYDQIDQARTELNEVSK